MLTLIMLAVALTLDRLVGDPHWLWAKLPHPVVVFGKAISFFEKQFNGKGLNDRDRRSYGVLTIVALLFGSVLVGWFFHRLLMALGPFGVIFEVLIVAVLLAQKSLSDHVAAVAVGLRADGIEGGRKAVAMIVGRDPNRLDRAGVSRAAIETLAENFSDGVIAPALYYAIFGLPGIFAYKMLNTADSMIGHKTPRYLQFGWASARLDDLANWPAARLSALLIAAAAFFQAGPRAARRSLTTAFSDSGLHRSPNSGWPESAMAGAIDVALAGPRVYAGETVSEPLQNGAGRRDIDAKEIDEALGVYASACTLFNVAVAALALLIMLMV
ncbi:adenosylcobinamide-phosphate synthase CbiB [Rhizobium sp. TRM95796]|uniref:adenosylcobinamide-phosphate synthase CbiB n=1 Tax=Rhizobium sp. TRM95796 TaxID=2979862 RepID=UPI0021E92760|nr:adenosylcobinamide-phosphate synthase CbiB [Rhizobium sp. TRM95796]MCV3764398.1 adenosylcobinamide-phosphate synthase CbiB [Rhizobium sp. TRM95796]